MVKIDKIEPLDMIEVIDNSGIDDTKRIVDSIGMAYAYLGQHDKVACAVSGGADSDIMLDLLWRLDKSNKVRYYFVNTGLEYKATKEHIARIQDKYDIVIETVYPKKSIPLACKEHGAPFLTKLISDAIKRLQRYGFDWRGDRSFEQDLELYPKTTRSIKWWHSKRSSTVLHPDPKSSITYNSIYNISSMPFLKEFMVQEPPKFLISDACCFYAKKEPAKRFIELNGCTMDCVGVRKAEGGARIKLTSCYHPTSDPNTKYDKFHPLLWYNNDDKAAYASIFGITHSDCYTVYGMKRTGCAGCPFAYKHKTENSELKNRLLQYEPDLWRAVQATFQESYEYTERYLEFAKTAAVDSVWRQLLDYDREYSINA